MLVMHLSPDERIFWQHGVLKLNATILFTWGLMFVLVVGSKLITRKLSTGLVRSRWQNVLEMIVTGIEGQIGEVGLRNPAKYLGFLGTLFLFLALCGQGVGCAARFAEQPLALRTRVIGRFLQDRRALLVELLVLVLELVSLLVSFGLLGAGVRELRGDPFFPRVDRVEDRPVEKTLHQPDEDDEVERLRSDGEPIDQHRLLARSLGYDVFPERVGEDENHRDDETVNGGGLDHRQPHEQGSRDGR